MRPVPPVRPLVLCLVAVLTATCGDDVPPPVPVDTEIRGERLDAAPPPPDEPATPPLVPAAPPRPPVDGAGSPPEEPYLDITFDMLRGYDWRSPVADLNDGEAPADDSIPSGVLALDGVKVRVQGYMLPLNLEAGRTTHFMLMHSLAACCFGGSPLMNEWIDVKLPQEEATDFVSLTPYKVSGRLRVGTKFVDGAVHSVYRMDGDEAVIADFDDW